MADPQLTPQQVQQMREDLADLRSIASDIGASLRNAFRADNVREFGNEIRSSLNTFNKIDQVLSDTSSALDKTIKKEISRKDLNKELSKLKSLESKIENEIAKVTSAKNVTTAKQRRLQQEVLAQLGDQLNLIKEQREEFEKTTKSYSDQKNALDTVKQKFEGIEKSLTRQAAQLFIFKAIIDAALSFNKISVQIGKNLGYGAAQSDKVVNNIVNAARGSENLNFTLANAGEAINQLVTSTGLIAEYSADTLETQIMLTKQFGLTEEEAAGIYKFSVLTGKAASQVNKEMVGAFVAARNSLKVGVPFKAVIAEAAKVSGQLAANFQNNPALITKAVVQAKALGTTLEQTKNQAESLLNFESSIENELKAELITGQQLNLERARAAALMGDQVAVMQELNNQGMTLEKFQNMNVIAQKSFAEAIGLSADQLANQLRQQKLATETGKSLAQITEEEAIEAQKRQNIQEQFNAAMLKLQDIIGGLVAGPLGMLLSILSDALSLVGKIVAGIQEVLGSGLTKVLLGAITGLAAGGPVGALIGGIAGAASAAMADDMIGYGARTLITPEGPIALNNNDTVIAGTNLFKGDDVISMGKGSLTLGSDISPLVEAINSVRASVDKLYAKDSTISMDGKTVGTTLTQNSYKLA